MSVAWIEYKGKKIIHSNYRGLRGKELRAAIDLEAKLVREAPGRVLILDDFTKAVVDSECMNYLQKIGKEEIEPKTEKCALLGVEGIKKMLLHAYNWFTGAGAHQRIFNSEQAAKDWLAE